MKGVIKEAARKIFLRNQLFPLTAFFQSFAYYAWQTFKVYFF